MYIPQAYTAEEQQTLLFDLEDKYATGNFFPVDPLVDPLVLESFRQGAIKRRVSARSFESRLVRCFSSSRLGLFFETSSESEKKGPI